MKMCVKTKWSVKSKKNYDKQEKGWPTAIDVNGTYPKNKKANNM